MKITFGTIYIVFRPDAVSSPSYLWSIYTPVTGGRQLALTLENGSPVFTWGYNNGEAYQDVTLPHSFTNGQEYIW